MCQVQKHGTEIIEDEVWLHFLTCSKGEGAKTKSAMPKMDTNVQHMSNIAEEHKSAKTGQRLCNFESYFR